MKNSTFNLYKLACFLLIAVLVTLNTFYLNVSEGGQTLLVAVSANLQHVFPQIIKGFEIKRGVTIKTSTASSGSLFAQVSNGAPFDIFLSADTRYPQKLYEAGFSADESPPLVYAYGKLVVFLPHGSGLDIERGLKLLTDPSVRKISIANPMLAPYGAAAIASFKNSGIYERVVEKLIFGENVSQALHFVIAGGANAAILPMSITLAPRAKESGVFWEIPPELYGRIAQGALPLKNGNSPEVARSFMKYLESPRARALLIKYGYAVPEEK